MTTGHSSIASRMFSLAFSLSFCLVTTAAPSQPCRAEEIDARQVYVGSAACMECHADEYRSFATYAKKSRSFESIEKLKKGLTAEEIAKCYFCHTTGYGKPGGFISAEETPDLKNAGCEVCHGPGQLHVRTREPADIKKHLTTEDCEVCHISERVKAFRYKPMIHGGAH